MLDVLHSSVVVCDLVYDLINLILRPNDEFVYLIQVAEQGLQVVVHRRQNLGQYCLDGWVVVLVNQLV